jgi:hypothetical protein
MDCRLAQFSSVAFIYIPGNQEWASKKQNFFHSLFNRAMSSLDRIFFISKRKPNNNPFGFHMFANKMHLTFISKHLFQI